nr:unnamed protein product [Haemonchus contortus]
MVEEVRLVGNSTKHLPSYLPSDGSARNYSDFLESEEEEDIQMTKLDKLAVRVVKRVAETIDVTTDDGGNWAIIEALQKPYAGAAEGHNLLDEAVIDGGLPREQIEKNSEVAEPPGKSGSESCLPSPTPPGNVWAKRQEERESHEKEKVNSLFFPISS